jgi:mono/diheme cytochrome c family protein
MSKYSGAFRSASCGLLSALALAVSAQAESRGELLYSTHCIACHTTQMHWRDQRIATDWLRLKAEVRRWQRTAALNWSEADIVEVARYLNQSTYRFVETPDPSASLGPQTGRERSGECSVLTTRWCWSRVASSARTRTSN